MRTRTGVLLVLLACLAAAAFAGRMRHEMADFEVYWTAGVRAAGGEQLYRPSDGHYQFKYFPASAFLFVPLTVLPLVAAKAVWFALSVGALVALLALSVRYLPTRVVASWIIVVATIVTLGKFYAHELTLGQVNLLLGAIAVAGLGHLQRGRELIAGAAFGAAVVVKPYAIVFLPYLAATKRYRAVGACAATVALMIALPALKYGVDGNLNLLSMWWETVRDSTPALLTNPDNISLAGMYAKWFGPGSMADRLTVVTSLLLLGIGAGVVARRRSSADPETLEVAWLLVAVVMLSPQGWDYALLLSTPAIMLIVNTLPRVGRALQVTAVACLGVVGLSIYDVMGRAAYGRFMALSVMTVVYGVLIGVIVYLRVRRIA